MSGNGTIHVEISPASTHLLSGAAGTAYRGAVSVANEGTATLKITTSVIGLTPSGPRCDVPKAPPSWLHVTGAKSFVLPPGQDHAIGYTVSAPAGTDDSAAVVATAAPLGHRTGANLVVSGGSRITVGTTQTCHGRPVALPPRHQAGNSLLGVAIVLAVLTLLSLAAWKGVTMWRDRGTA